MDGLPKLILNSFAKIVIGETDVYFGRIVAYDSDSGLVELEVKSWRDKDDNSVPFRRLHTNVRYLTKVDYLNFVSNSVNSATQKKSKVSK